MVSSRKILGAGGGGFGVGLLLLIGGLVVKHSQAKMLAECSSGLGQFGQVLDPNTAKECSTAQALSSMATGAIWIGAIVLAIAVGGFVALLIVSGARAASGKPKTVVPTAGRARPAGPAPSAPVFPYPAGGAVLRPIVPVVVSQEDGPSAYPTGRPAAGDRQRDVFAAEPAVSASGAEITTVLPIFAPAERADLAAPAMVPGRSSERSLASVAPGPQVGLADRPPAAASQVGLADRPPAAASQVGLADRPPAAASQVGLADRPPAARRRWAWLTARPPLRRRRGRSTARRSPARWRGRLTARPRPAAPSVPRRPGGGPILRPLRAAASVPRRPGGTLSLRSLLPRAASVRALPGTGLSTCPLPPARSRAGMAPIRARPGGIVPAGPRSRRLVPGGTRRPADAAR